MDDYVKGNWESTNFLDANKKVKHQKGQEEKGKTGNVVPFFPIEWKLNANDVFN